MKRFLAVVSVLIPLFLLAKDKTIYFDKKWKVTDSAHASYYRHVTKQPDGRYKVEDYYLTGKLQMTGSYKWLAPDKDSGIEDGHFVYYDSIGFVNKVGNCVNNKPIGTWTFYYEHSKRISGEHRCINDTSYLRIGYDSITQKKRYEGRVIRLKPDDWQETGIWKWYYADGKSVKEIDYVSNGLSEGWSKFYDSLTHQILVERRYEHGRPSFPWKEYYPGGKQVKNLYYKDSTTGPVRCISYDKTGKITERK